MDLQVACDGFLAAFEFVGVVVALMHVVVDFNDGSVTSFVRHYLSALFCRHSMQRRYSL